MLAVTLAISVLAVACVPHDARAIWTQVVKKCAKNDLIGSDVLYFGPSNADGPGTVFQPFQSGGTQESHLPSEYISNVQAVIGPNQTFSCSGNTATSFSLGADVPVETTLPVSGSVAVNLKRASKVTVSADSLAWVSLVTGPYKDLVISLNDSSTVKKDITQNGHLVLSRALSVKGMKAELEFSSSVGADVKAKVPNVTGDKGIAVTSAWDGTTKLTISAPTDFYIAGELRKWEAGGLAANEIGPQIKGVASIVVRRSQ